MIFRTFHKLLIPAVLFLLLSGIGAQDGGTQSRVKYISANHIYLDQGSAAGLSTDDTLLIKRNNRTIAEAVVEFISAYSSSCKIIVEKLKVEAGDIAVLKTANTIEKSPEPVKEAVTKKEYPMEKTYKQKRITRKNLFRGSVSLQFYHWDDLENTALDFTQPTFRINLRANRLWGKDINLRIKSRSRYNQRARRLHSNAPESEWRNRIYEMSLSYDNNNAFLNYRIGRIISNTFSGVGYIDGILIQQNISRQFKTGIFAGTQPEWQYSEFQTSIQKYGGYLNYIHGDYGSNRFESTIAAAGEYHGKTVSREFLYFQNSYYMGNRLNFYQSAELDINRDWRKDRTGDDYELTNFYISGRYSVTSWLQFGLMYDNRKNFQTYETRSIADSLFQDAFRYGWRGSVTLRLPAHYQAYSNIGIRKRKTDSDYTYSYTAGLNKANLLIRGLSLFANGSGFSNFFTEGINYSFTLSKYFLTDLNLSLAAGGYTYQLKSVSMDRKNQWLRGYALINIFRNYFLSGQYEYSWGDDVHGHRILMETGYRF